MASPVQWRTRHRGLGGHAQAIDFALCAPRSCRPTAICSALAATAGTIATERPRRCSPLLLPRWRLRGFGSSAPRPRCAAGHSGRAGDASPTPWRSSPRRTTPPRCSRCSRASSTVSAAGEGGAGVRGCSTSTLSRGAAAPGARARRRGGMGWWCRTRPPRIADSCSRPRSPSPPLGACPAVHPARSGKRTRA